MNNTEICLSIVLFHNNEKQVERAIRSFMCSSLQGQLYLVDNSSNDQLKKLTIIDSRIKYVYNDKNIGYGSGHNVAIKKAINNDCKYHIVLNPDIYFDSNVLKSIFEYMEKHPEVGLIMPKILYPNGEIQHLCKLLPTPFDLIVRRFLPCDELKGKNNYTYELKFTDYNTEMEVPYLSGCFMFLRVSALKNIGLFDERYFMYGEDTDLSRRVHQKYKTIYFPEVSIVHEYQKESYKSIKMTLIHLRSMIQYFNKWGWFVDKERSEANEKTLKRLGWKG